MSTTRRVHVTGSAISLGLANLVTIVIADWQGWPLLDVLWVYWAQSLTIVFFHWRRILNLKQFSTQGLVVDARQLEPTRETQRLLAWSFLLCFGFLHFIYLENLINEEKLSLGTFVCILVFVANHAFSYFHNRQEDMNRTPHAIAFIVILPCQRILPMHFAIWAASMVAAGGSLLLILALKTLVDVTMHIVQHTDMKAKT